MPAARLAASALSVDFGIWEFIWRSLVLLLGSCFVIPVPWLLVWYLKWIVSCVQRAGTAQSRLHRQRR